MVEDPIADGVAPHCPECGAVLREAGTAYACHSCRIVVVSSIPVFPPLRRPSATG